LKLGTLKYLGDYELLEEIARGGMGIVFKARQVSLNRMVAVKLISAGALATPELVKRFRAEAEAAASLSHPNIVPIYEIGEHQGQHYFSMALIDGSNLSARLAHRPLGDLRAASQMISTLARAVHFAHQRGILHRDLKPGNVVLDGEDKPYLTDFGLAKVVQGDSTLTRTHAVLGTPAYMAPEQARGDTKDVTIEADVYGLGAVLYETLTGAAPFGGSTSFETIRQVLDQEPRRPSSSNPAVDRDLETICLKCLEKDGTRRYASAQALAEDLDRWLGHEPIRARPSTALEFVGKWVRRRPAVAALTASLALALIGGVIGVTLEWRQAVGQRKRADQNASSLRQHLYGSDMAVAWQSWAEGDVRRTRELLDEAAQQGQELRGFEWRYLWGLSRPSELFWFNTGTSARYSPDGRLLAIANYVTGEATVWDMATRQVLKSFKPYSSGFWCTAFSPDGKILATCSRSEPLFKFWDLTTGKQIGALTNRGQEAFVVAFSPNGKQVLTVSASSYQAKPADVRIWDFASKKELKSLPGLTSWGIRADFSPKGETVAFGDGEGLVRLWNWVDGSVRVLRGHKGIVFEVRFSPDGTILASGDESGLIILWDWASGNVERIWPGHQGPIYGLAVSRDGGWLASAGRDHTAKLWKMDTGEELARFLGHSNRVMSVDFSPDNRTLVTSSETTRFWKAVPQQHSQILTPSRGGNHIGYSLDSRFLLVSEATTNQVTLWDAATRSIARSLPGTDFCVSPDGKILTLIQKSNVVIYETATMAQIGTIAGGAPLSGGTAISPDVRLLALRSEGRPVIMDLQQRCLITTLEADSTGPDPMMFTHDSKLLITAGSADGAIRLRYVLTRQTVGWLRGHPDRVRALALSPDGLLLASASEATIRLWNLATRTAADHPVLTGNNGDIGALAFSSDGKTLAAGSFDGPIKLWSVPGRQEIGSLKGHLSVIYGLAFSPDGQTLASTSFDHAVRLWRAPGFHETDRDP
jgi:WD40 repeat protein/predicted Ser/Thr protein kinase